MAPTEYLAFIPLLIYGIAIADLLGEWKRFFDKDKMYLPYLLYTLVFTEVAIYNVFIYVEILDDLVGQPYIYYLLFILPPFLYILMVNVFTPEKDANTKTHFKKSAPIFLSLMAAFSVLFIATTAIYRKQWMIYGLIIMWFVLLITRFGVITT